MSVSSEQQPTVLDAGVTAPGVRRQGSANSGSASGSYLVLRHLKDFYSQATPASPGNSPAKASFTQSRFAGSFSADAELTFLRAENARLQAENEHVLSKLAFIESRASARVPAPPVPGAADGTIHITAAKAPKAKQKGSPSDPTVLDAAESYLDEVLLSAVEMDEAAMRCTWLAHYWGLAAELGVCPEVSVEQARHWRRLAVPESVFIDLARASSKPHMSQVVCPNPDGAAAAAQDEDGHVATAPAPPGNAEPAASRAPVPHMRGATACDLVEIERALRQLSELRIVQQVVSTLLLRHQRQEALSLAAGLSLEDDDDPSVTDPSAASLSRQAGAGPHSSPLAAEVHFQTAWVAYLWSRAAGAGVLPHLSSSCADQWAYKLHHQEQHWRQQGAGVIGAAQVSGVQMRLIADLEVALHEITRLGVESWLWRARSRAADA